MANRRFIDFPVATTVGAGDIILIFQDGLNKQTTKATILSGLPEDLEDLTDVDISGLTNGQILRYNSTTGKWENTDQANLDLSDLNDVSIVSPANGQVLVYNSGTGKWENSSAGFVPYTGAVTTVNLGVQQIIAGSFAKTGGTAAQFLKADGSVDSTAYGTGSVTSVGLTMPAAFTVANSPVTGAGTIGVTGAGTTAQYIRGDGSLETFPGLTGFVPYTGANQTVNLNTQQLQAGHTTVTTNGSGETLTVNHTSGSGIGINITKGGNNEGLRVNKTSGSGNAATIIGTLEATTLVKTGGTSAQFLKADGTVDSNVYALNSALASYQLLNQKGQPNGYAALDGNGKVPLTQINDALIGNVNYKGLYNAATNTPTLLDPPAVDTKGHYFIVNVAGTFAAISFEVGDWIISNGSEWSKVDNTDAVSSVFGRTGNVSAAIGDYNTSQVTENTNLYYTEARVNANANVAANTAARHNAVTLGTANGLSLSVQQLSLGLASAGSTGALSSADWAAFNSKQNAIALTTTGNSGAATLVGTTLNIPAYTLAGLGGQPQLNGTGFVKISGTTITYDNNTYYLASNPAGYTTNVGTVTSVGLSAPTGFAVSNTPVTNSGTLALAFAAGYSLPTNASQNTWDISYNRSLTAAAVTGTTTKTLTLTKQDGTTLTATWTDINTDAVNSVFGRTGAVVANNGDYNTSQVTELTNLYFTTARARAALSAGTGISYNSTTGVITSTITQYTNALARAALSFVAGSGAYNSSTGVITIPTNNNQIANGAGYITSSALGAYLPLVGGTLTGNLNGTSAVFSSNFYVSGGTNTNTGNGVHLFNESNFAQAQLNGVTGSLIDFSTSGSDFLGRIIYTNSTNAMQFHTNSSGTPRLTLASTGAATFSSSVTAGGAIKLQTPPNGTNVINFGTSAINYHTITYDDSTGKLTFNTDGTPRVVSFLNSNVGIGTATPAANLDVVGATGIYQRHSTGGRLVFDDTDTADASTPMTFISNTAGALQFGRANRSATTGLTTGSVESMRITSSGNVGIGTATPATKLHISGAGAQVLRIENTNTAIVLNNIIGSLVFQSNDASVGGTGVAGSINSISEAASGVNYGLGFNTKTFATEVERMRITAEGNVGIGETSPSELLQISKTQSATTRLQITNAQTGTSLTIRSSVRVTANDRTGEMVAVNGDHIYVGSTTNHNTNIMANGGAVLTATPAGNVGIGTSVFPFNPKLAVNSTGQNTIAVQTTDTAQGSAGTIMYMGTGATTGNSTHGVIRVLGNGGTAAANLVLQPTGNVLIGTTTDNGARLQVSGAATFSSSVTANRFSSIGAEQAYAWERGPGTSNVFSLNANSVSAYIRNNTTGNVLMTFLNAGNVGIGTTTDLGHKLQIGGTSTDRTSLSFSNTTTTRKYEMGLHGSSGTFPNRFFIFDNFANGYVFTIRASSVSRFHGPLETLELTSETTTKLATISGNVLVGTTTDVTGARLNVNGNIRTAAPTGGSAENWKWGNAVNGTVNANRLIRVEIAGVGYDLVARQII